MRFHWSGFISIAELDAEDVDAGARATRKTKGVTACDRKLSKNYDNTARARETYEVISADEFIETFELGEPGKPLQVYSRNHFKRVK